METTLASRSLDNPAYIVAIGTSAGGQESLKEFFRDIPSDLSAAFVVIMHLSRDYHSRLDDILKSFTNMPVKRVADNMPVESGTVFVMPQDIYLEIAGNRFVTVERPEEKINNSINHFFGSLAKDHDFMAIGVILSGMGSDGSEGSIKLFKQGGQVLVQSPSSTAFPHMAENAISADHPEYILPPGQLGQQVTKIINCYS